MNRDSQATKASLVGLITNLGLFIVKWMIGLFSHSIAIMTDSYNNLSDASGNLGTILSFTLSSREADKDHPYGHGRYEYLTGLILAVVVTGVGLMALKDALLWIISPKDVVVSNIALVVLVMSIVVKYILSSYYLKVGKAIESSIFTALGIDSRQDSIMTLATLISMLLAKYNIQIDGWIGLVVAILVLKGGIELVNDTLKPIIGTTPDPRFIKELSKCVLAHSDIYGIHDIMVHDYGVGHRYVSLHVEISSEMSLVDAHYLIDELEETISLRYECETMIHPDPIDMHDPFIQSLRQRITAIIKNHDISYSLHDFQKNGDLISFDVLLTDRNEDIESLELELRELLLRDIPNCHIRIRFDYAYGV